MSGKLKGSRGLTLIELVVVLFILAALAGVAVGIIPNFKKQTHGSTSAASLRAGETAITASLTVNGTLGNNFDGLISGGAGGAVPDYVANSSGLVPFTLTAAELGALAELGITATYPTAFADSAALETADAHATFDGHDYTAAVALAVGDDVAALAPTAIAQVEDDYNLSTTPDQIFAFGLGQESSVVGLNQAFKEAPLHTPGEGSAASRYSRYMVLVGYEAGEEPFYIGITCLDDFENFNNISWNLGEYFEASN